MKIFAIKNEYDNTVLSYLFYYETADKFCVETVDSADEWDTPFYISSFVKRGIFTLDANQIMEQIGEKDLPACIKNRLKKRIDFAIPLPGSDSLLVFFANSKSKICKINRITENYPAVKKYLSLHPEEFKNVRIEAGGAGISWNETLIIPYTELYKCGKAVGIRKSDLCSFVSEGVVNTAQAAQILNCTRQNIDNLMKRGKLKPVKEMANDKLFLKSDILKRV